MTDRSLPVAFPHTSTLTPEERSIHVRQVIARRQNFDPSTGIRPIDWSLQRNHLLAITAWNSLQSNSPAEARLWNTLAVQNSLPPTEDEGEEEESQSVSDGSDTETYSSVSSGASSVFDDETRTDTTEATEVTESFGTGWRSVYGDDTDTTEDVGTEFDSDNDTVEADDDCEDPDVSDEDDIPVRPYAFMYRSDGINVPTMPDGLRTSEIHVADDSHTTETVLDSSSDDESVIDGPVNAEGEAPPASSPNDDESVANNPINAEGQAPPAFSLEQPLPQYKEPTRAALKKSKFANLTVEQLKAKRTEVAECLSKYAKWHDDCQAAEDAVFENEQDLSHDQKHRAARRAYQDTTMARKKIEIHWNDMAELEALITEPEAVHPDELIDPVSMVPEFEEYTRRDADQSHRFRYTVDSWDESGR